MDDRCKDALRFMKLPHLITAFEEHQIDYETLKLFHEYPDTISTVVPNLGDSLKLRRGLKLLCEGPEYSGDCYDGMPYYQTQVTLSSEDSSPSPAPPAPPSSSEVAILAIETSDGKRMRVDVDPEHTQSVQDVHDVHDVHGDHSGHGHPDERDEREPVITVHENFSRNYIRDILERTAIGKALLQQHKLGMLDNTARCKLAEIIIHAEYGADTDTTIDGKRFVQLAKWTAECMPGELVVLQPAENQQLKSSLEFLETHLKPWEEVQECWERTSTFRLCLLRDPNFRNLKGVDYINRYPILKQPGGYLLLEHDFGVLFTNARKSWLECWPEFSAKLKKELITNGVKDDNLDCEAGLLYNYPKLFAVVPVRIPNQKPWRASRADIQDGFLVHLKMVGDYDKTLEDMKKTLEIKGLELYPFPMIVGEDLSCISSSYVVIDGIPLRVESPLRAVEVAFKCYHALNCHYPPQSVRLWTVIAKAVFGVDDEWLKIIESSSEVKRLIAVLKCAAE